MYRKYLTPLLGLGLVSVVTLGCGKSAHGVRMEGSDTMVTLAQAWAEKYHEEHPETTIEVLAGDSAAGIASLIDGTCDLANASREMAPEEKERIKAKYGVDAQSHIVGFDALAVYVHKGNPLDSISIEELTEIYGQDGKINKWSQLGVESKGLRKAKIIRVSPPNSSGTYAYFQEAVLENKRDYKLGSIDQIGSKDLVATIHNAIGYSSMGNVAPGVKMLKISAKTGEPGIAPTVAKETCYPLTRSLLIYTVGEPTGHAKEFLDWILGPDGQGLVAQLGFVPVEE